MAGHEEDEAFVAPSRAQKAAIWVIGGYLALNAGAGMVFLFLLAGGAIPLAADKRELLDAFPPLLYFAGFVNIFLTLAGGVFLVMRKRVALPFLAAAAVAKVGSQAFASPPASSGLSPTVHAVSMVGEIVVLAAILAFVFSLWRRRLLEP